MTRERRPPSPMQRLQQGSSYDWNLSSLSETYHCSGKPGHREISRRHLVARVVTHLLCQCGTIVRLDRR